MGNLRVALLFLVLIWICSARMGFTCKEAERKALLELKHSFIDRWNRLGSWVGQDCCNWKGVGCDNVTGNVVKLDLRWDILSLDPPSYLVASEVNPALLELTYLSYLDLSGNVFNWSKIPEFLGSMKQLRYLNLSYADFSGKLPPHLGNLTNLVFLDLSFACYKYCRMEGNSLEWASKLESLQYLDLSMVVDLSQSLDALNILHKLPSLLVLIMSESGLGDSHYVIRNSTVASSPIHHLDLTGNSLSVTVSHFIQNLSSIRFLDLSGNNIVSPISPWLGDKVNLEHLNLFLNHLDGSFPHFIQNMSSLTFLDLSHNQFSSSIPSWLANQQNLEHVSLRINHFDRVDGGIMNIIFNLCRLKYLNLSYNQLQEEISKSNVYFSRCSRYNLEYLHMHYNNISGWLPVVASFSSHQALAYNNLRVVSLANFSSLRSLDTSSNSLVLDLPTDWIPRFQLEFLSIIPCKLNSPFPNWLLNQKKLSDLDLSDTGIFGPLPENIGISMPSLQSIQLANNHINGSIPRSLCGIAGLNSLHLQNNTLSGMIPDCWENSQIAEVDLSSNKLSGTIPISLIKAPMYSLRLNKNSIEGELPFPWRKCGDLALVDVSMNKLHGEIPPWNGANFPSLQILILRENRFEGKIPLQLCSVQTLHIINLANNNLVGAIPQCFGYFKRMGSNLHSSTTIALPPNPIIAPKSTSALSPAPSTFTESSSFARGPASEWSAQEVVKGKDMEYTTILKQLVNMDLSCNHLVGMIPVEITSLSLLLGLNFSHNHLNGTIPIEVGEMRSLESLDLSFNNLSGSIPESIASLDYLSNLNFSFNNLQGQIPTGRHLQTLNDSSIYMGNPGLCGDPSPKKCSGDETAHPPTSVVLEDGGDNKKEKRWFYMVIMLGFATGFWGVIGILVVHKRWRFAYFRIAEELADWIYVRVAVRIAKANRGRG